MSFMSVFIFLTEITFCFIAREIFIELCVSDFPRMKGVRMERTECAVLWLAGLFSVNNNYKLHHELPVISMNPSIWQFVFYSGIKPVWQNCPVQPEVKIWILIKIIDCPGQPRPPGNHRWWEGLANMLISEAVREAVSEAVREAVRDLKING